MNHGVDAFGFSYSQYQPAYKHSRSKNAFVALNDFNDLVIHLSLFLPVKDVLNLGLVSKKHYNLVMSVALENNLRQEICPPFNSKDVAELKGLYKNYRWYIICIRPPSDKKNGKEYTILKNISKFGCFMYVQNALELNLSYDTNVPTPGHY
ncbi:hypothetical protein AKO1_007572, partial [Acrasis kona]